jgi:hypothetical protein
MRPVLPNPQRLLQTLGQIVCKSLDPLHHWPQMQPIAPRHCLRFRPLYTPLLSRL